MHLAFYFHFRISGNNKTVGLLQTHLGYVHTWRLFWSCRCLFYIIILWSKPYFQKSPERFLKTPAPASFSAAQSVFSSWKSLTFLKKTPYVKRLFLTADHDKEWRVVSITTKTQEKGEIATDRTSLGAQGCMKPCISSRAPGLNCWKHHTVSIMSRSHKRRCEPTYPPR